MKTSIHYKMVFETTDLMPKAFREQGMKAWVLRRVIDDDNNKTIQSEDVAIFNLDSEAMTFQRFLFGGGSVEIHPETAELITLERKNRRG